jgi:hypothetical protein
MPTLKGIGFHGMNNLPHNPDSWVDDAKLITPRMILNADVADNGIVKVRGGYKKTCALVRSHSLWANSVMLVVAQGINYPTSLYRVEGDTAHELGEVTGPRARVEYVEINNVVYMSNPYWNAAYGLGEDRLRAWGVPIPTAPYLDLTQDGDLVPGHYKLCYTGWDGQNIGGNGAVSEISWESGTRGIRLVNMPESVIPWITQVDGGDFFMAPLKFDHDGPYIASPNYTQPLPTFSTGPPSKLSCLAQALGRIWGGQGNLVRYTLSFRYELFDLANQIPFPEPITLIATYGGGLYVNSLESTWLCDGEDPKKMQITRVGNGAIPGSLMYANFEAGPNAQVGRTFAKSPLPCWASKMGFVVGTIHGRLVHLTESKLKFVARAEAAADYRMVNGQPQLLVTMRGNTLESSRGDSEIASVVQRGKLFIPQPLHIAARGGITIQ